MRKVQTKIGQPWHNAWFHLVPINLPLKLFLEQKLSRLCLELPVLPGCFVLSPSYSTQGCAMFVGWFNHSCVCSGQQPHVQLGLRPSVVTCSLIQLSLQTQSAYHRADTSRNSVLKVEQRNPDCIHVCNKFRKCCL